MATSTVGVEVVREVKNDESEEAILVRTDNPVTVQVGESAGNVITAEAQYFLVVDVHVGQKEIAADLGLNSDDVSDEELSEMFESMGIPTEINEGVVALSNEDGEVGHAVIREDGADIDSILDEFTERFL